MACQLDVESVRSRALTCRNTRGRTRPVARGRRSLPVAFGGMMSRACRFNVLALVFILSAAVQSSAGADSAQPAPFTGAAGRWEGFDRFELEVNGRKVSVIAPVAPAPGNPWLLNNWYGDPFSKEVTAALLSKGVYY